MSSLAVADPIDKFITRWKGSQSAERANFQSFAIELSKLLTVEAPRPSNGDDVEMNDYCFERGVTFKEADGSTSAGRIDLYKRGAFVLEAKQSRARGRNKALSMVEQTDLFGTDLLPPGKRGRRSGGLGWDNMMINARRQAEDYARALPVAHGWPPFVLVCDVGHCIEVYADFSGQGKNYAQFPDRNGFRIHLEDLRNPEIRARLKLIWENPIALDPARQSAKVTREIAARLAAVSKHLEARGHNAENVAIFLMRCLFTMFAEDVGLLPEKSFQTLLEEAARDPKQFAPMVEQLWKAMDVGDFAYAIRQSVRKFNGKLFKNAHALVLEREEIGELAAAAKYNWREVDPSIFGTLLEQALDSKERAKLGAHYTPRAYVERLVLVTVLEPLRQEWAQVQATAERFNDEGKRKEAIDVVRGFHDKLCATRVLDPACGTGNFLYVALEMMKRLEGDVLESLADLGGQEALALDRQTVDPHQFLGMELNPRAAAIAELVVWIGYLQWHFRTQSGVPNEPILKDFRNINPGVPPGAKWRGYDAVLTWDGYPEEKFEVREGVPTRVYPNARKPDWPEAEYIVGNPPFIAGQDFRRQFGDAYAEALWQVYKPMPGGADFVMYWWDRAAGLVAAGSAKRFGLVTTNSITMAFSRRVVAKHLDGKEPVSLLMAIPDHPWTKVTDDSAAVRIGMTVGIAGRHEGGLREVIRESGLKTDQPEVEFKTTVGRINADLTVGSDVTAAEQLSANLGICHDGVKLHGAGFIVTPAQAEALGLGKRLGLEAHIRSYRNGRDLAGTPRGAMVIDFFGLASADVRARYPEAYQHLLQSVKPNREAVAAKSNSKDALEYARLWWIFGKPRQELRPALAGLQRFIATVDTAKHRIFQFLPSEIICDDKIVVVAADDAMNLGTLSSRIHVTWSLRAGGWLGVGNDPVYVKSRCFDPFPFPIPSDALKTRIRAVAEELDAHRKARQAEHPKLTLTQMYNALETLRAGEKFDGSDERAEAKQVEYKRIKTEALILILKELHDSLDALVFEAYGWPPSLSDEDILERLVALNKQRALAEKVGAIHWLRPDYQIPRFGSDAERARLADEKRRAAEGARPRQGALDLDDDLQEMQEGDDSRPAYPTGHELAETAAVMSALATAPAPLTIPDISRGFKQGLKVEKRVALTVLALARLGHITLSDGDRFGLRR